MVQQLSCFYLLLQYGNFLSFEMFSLRCWLVCTCLYKCSTLHACRLRSNFFLYGDMYSLSLSLSLFLSPLGSFAASPGSTGAFSFSACTYIESTLVSYLTNLYIIIFTAVMIRGADASSALDFGCSQIGIGTMGSCRDFCACTILQSSSYLGANYHGCTTVY